MKRLEQIFSKIMNYVTGKFTGVVTVIIEFNQGGIRDATINKEAKVEFDDD